MLKSNKLIIFLISLPFLMVIVFYCQILLEESMIMVVM